MTKNLTYSLSLLFIIFCTAMYGSENRAKSNKPNIIMFLVDDMGWQETSVPFYSKVTELNKRYHTPNLEHLDIAKKITWPKQKLTEMAKVFSGFLRETEGQMPVVKKNNNPVPYPDEVI